MTTTMYAAPATLKFLKVDGKGKEVSGQLVKVPALASSVMDTLKSLLELTDAELSKIVGVPERTYHRYKSSGEDLKPAHADAALRAARLLQEAHRTFGDKQKVLRWLKANHPILGDKPINLIGSDAGAQAVADELVRIQWGDVA